MTDKPRQDPTPERLRELMAEGAVGASTAFAQLVGRTLLAREPQRVEAGRGLPAADWASGIFFEVEGDLRGHVALLLSASTGAVLEGLLPRGAPGAPDELVHSLLLELGNIVASQALSAVANGLGGRIVLSIPSLVVGHPERELSWRAQRQVAGRGGTRIELGFDDSGGALRALLVLLPALEG